MLRVWRPGHFVDKCPNKKVLNNVEVSPHREKKRKRHAPRQSTQFTVPHRDMDYDSGPDGMEVD